MLKRSHFLISAGAGAATAYLLGHTPTGDPATITAYALGAGLAGLLPDADHPGSVIGRLLPGWWHRLTPGHRGPSHAPAVVLAIGAVIAFAGQLLGAPALGQIGLILTVGMGGHIFADQLTTAGCPLLYPLSRRRWPLPGWVAIRTGGWAEQVYVAVACTLVAVLLSGNWATATAIVGALASAVVDAVRHTPTT